MTAPSNANTSGLVEIAYARIENGKLLDLSRLSWGNYEPLVTAASAQARIAELERWQAAAIRSARIHDENIREFDARATAAEARADRLAKALERIERSKSQTYGHLQSVARAALQQETQK